VIDLTGSSSPIDHKPLPENDPRKRKPDITLANALLGWEPAVDLEHGLKQTITYFEKIIRNLVF
jgi:UDP-glucuronate decarboxylase